MNKVTSSFPRYSVVDLSTQTPLLTRKVLCLVFIPMLFVSCALAQDSALAARVNDAPISREEVDKTIASQIFSLQQQIYALRKTALENLIGQRLTRDEAHKLGISTDLLKEQWLAGPAAIDPDEVEQRYQQNASAFGMMSPDEAKQKLRMDMEANVKLKKYRDRVSSLRSAAKVEILLEEPKLALPRRSVFAASGPESARVVIAEFSDFQCHYCRAAQPSLKRILETFPNEVRLEYKHFPLEMHEYSFQAAQAANCAGEQNAFWKMHDALFRVERFSDTTIKDIAKSLPLDVSVFDQCLLSKDARRTVLADIAEANGLGVQGTPTLIVNGKPFRGNPTFEALKAVVESEIRNLSTTLPTASTSLQKGNQ
jgi:protein-disulfide isomerase